MKNLKMIVFIFIWNFICKPKFIVLNPFWTSNRNTDHRKDMNFNVTTQMFVLFFPYFFPCSSALFSKLHTPLLISSHEIDDNAFNAPKSS